MMEIKPGDGVRLKKKHPCGGYDWVAVRVGADIVLRCLTCGRSVSLPRGGLERRIKEVTPHPGAG